MRTIYLDYNATTPLDDAVREAMLPALEALWGNPSSVHHLGQAARARLDDARDRIAATLDCKPSELIFTSGGTESANHAILGAARLRREKGRHIVTSQFEHHAVLHPCEYLANKEGFEVTFLPPSPSGHISLEQVHEAIRPDTILVSIMAANNEVGTIQPFAEIGELCADKGVLFHTDAVQVFGKLPNLSLPFFNADLISLCGHKIHGPKGAGLLYAKSPLQLPPLLHGGSHENERRPGTENLPGILGLAESIVQFVPFPPFAAPSIASMVENLRSCLSSIEGVNLLGTGEILPNTTSFIVKYSDSIALLSALDLEGLCASSGTACSSGSVNPSHVVEAMGFSSEEANSLVRFSLGRENSPEQIDFAVSVLPRVIGQCRSADVAVNEV